MMTQDDPKYPDNANGGGEPPAPNHEIVAAINALGEKYKASQQGRPEHDQQTLKWAKRAGIGVGIYTLITLGIAVIALCQLQTSRDTEERSLRAYVFLVPDNEVTVVTFPSTIDIANYEINVRNSGTTPAYKVLGNSWVTLERWPLPDDFKYEGPKDDSVPGGGQVIPPKGVVHYHTGTSRPLTLQEWSDLQAGTKVIYIYGGITYTDAFDSSRYTNFCLASAKARTYDASFKSGTAHCPRHNDSN